MKQSSLPVRQMVLQGREALSGVALAPVSLLVDGSPVLPPPVRSGVSLSPNSFKWFAPAFLCGGLHDETNDVRGEPPRPAVSQIERLHQHVPVISGFITGDCWAIDSSVNSVTSLRDAMLTFG